MPEDETITKDEPATVHGQDEASLDAKARLGLLADKRRFLGEDFVISECPLGCLAAYPKSTWATKMKALAALSPADPARQYYEHIVLQTVVQNIRWDNQGRIVVPLRLRERAGLEHDVIVVGCTDHVQIWNPGQLEKYRYFLTREWELRRGAPVPFL